MDLALLLESPADELVDALGQSFALMNATHSAVLDLIAAFEARELAREDYARSTADWLTMRFALAPETAREYVRVAQTLRELPAIAAVFAAGGMSFDQLAAVTRYATAEDDEELARTAPHRPASALRREAARRHRVSLQDATARHEARRLELHEHLTGWGMHADLSSAEGWAINRELRKRAETMPVNPLTGVQDPFPARMADALFELICGNEAPSRAPRNHGVVYVQTDGRCNLQGGPPIATETAERLLCAATIEVAVRDATGHTLGMTTAADRPTRQISNDVWERDGGCVICGRTWCLHEHHMIQRVSGGKTEPGNLGLVCSTHHIWVHEYGWRLELIDGMPTLIRPDGTPHDFQPPSLRPEIRHRFFDSHDTS